MRASGTAGRRFTAGAPPDARRTTAGPFTAPPHEDDAGPCELGDLSALIDGPHQSLGKRTTPAMAAELPGIPGRSLRLPSCSTELRLIGFSIRTRYINRPADLSGEGHRLDAWSRK